MTMQLKYFGVLSRLNLRLHRPNEATPGCEDLVIKSVSSLVLTFVSFLFGVGLPYVEFSGQKRFLNLFWSSAYGLGLWSLDKTANLCGHSPISLLGVLGWPLVLACAIFFFCLSLQRSDKTRLRWVLFVLFCASSVCVVDLQKSLQPPLSQLPTFYRYFFVIW